ncbi:acyl-CoA N-acyltransferase [Stemphylium lycopersici]|nr:acyl-CoA N-acyltransferase [Stemphylium lycopersici]
MPASANDERLGRLVPDTPASPPSNDIKLSGQYATIVPVHPDHAADLYELIKGDANASLFDFIFDAHPKSAEELRASLEVKAATTHPWTYTILRNNLQDGSSKPVGMVDLMRMDLPNRVIEVGNIQYTPALQRTPAATEAMYLLAKYVFETLGFRRYEWKCNSLNHPSRRAAERLGFKYEGTFRQHLIVRGRNRDTNWYSILDSEWEEVKRGMEKWLHASNFDGEGRQKKTLQELRES